MCSGHHQIEDHSLNLGLLNIKIQMLKDLPVQVEKPSMSGLVVEVHPHGQHDVVAPVVLGLDTIFLPQIGPSSSLSQYLQNYNLHDHKHNHDNFPDFLPFQQIASSG